MRGDSTNFSVLLNERPLMAESGPSYQRFSGCLNVRFREKRTLPVPPMILSFYRIPGLVELGRRGHIVRLSATHAKNLTFVEIPTLDHCL